MVKNLPVNVGDGRLIPWWGRSLGEGNGNPLQYFCLGNPMKRRAWWATVHGVAKESDTTERLTLLLSLAAQNNRRSCVGAGGVVSSCLIGILPLLSCFSRVRPCATPWTVAARLLCPWGFSWQEYQSGLPCPPSGNLPGPGIELESSACRQIFNS